MERLGERIPPVKADQYITYLGGKYSVWSGISLSDLQADLTQVVKRVQKLRLKPNQKINLLQTYRVPHYLHQLVLATPAARVLKALDQVLRVAIRKILHLPQSTCNCIIYCGRGDGGLGFPKLEELVPRVGLSMGLRFLNSQDPVIGALGGCPSTTARLRRLAATARIDYPYTESDLRSYKSRCKRSELNQWSKLQTQGKAVWSFTADKIGNSFLKNPTLLKPSRFITALQLRTNTAGNRTSLHRACPQPDLKCRKCKLSLETLGHIIGQCTHTKSARIRRHDEIKDFIETTVQKLETTEVCKEPNLLLDCGEKLKPDLVIKNQSGVFVVDVTVRHEDG
jgi:hypothetical protein